MTVGGIVNDVFLSDDSDIFTCGLGNKAYKFLKS